MVGIVIVDPREVPGQGRSNMVPENIGKGTPDHKTSFRLALGPLRIVRLSEKSSIQYLAGMTSRVDQKIGNQAPERL